MRQDTEMNKNMLVKEDEIITNFKHVRSPSNDISGQEEKSRSSNKNSSKFQSERSPEEKSPTERASKFNKDSEMNIGSTSAGGMRSNETPNPLRDQTPSQLTSKKSPSPSPPKEEKKDKIKIQFPMKNNDLIDHFSEYLSKYEQKEILKYPEIHYFNFLERKLAKKNKDINGQGAENYSPSMQRGKSQLNPFKVI